MPQDNLQFVITSSCCAARFGYTELLYRAAMVLHGRFSAQYAHTWPFASVYPIVSSQFSSAALSLSDWSFSLKICVALLLPKELSSLYQSLSYPAIEIFHL